MTADPYVAVRDARVRMLRNGREAFPAMLDAIGAARDRVFIEMYWWEADEVGDRFRDAVIAAARRGVEVRVLVDGFGSRALPRRYWHALARAGGRAATFSPLQLVFAADKIRLLLARDHRKIVVADDCAFVGGLNFARPWAPTAEGGSDWRDTALEIRSDAAASALVALFESTWAVAAGQRVSSDPPPIAWPDRGSVAIVSNTPTRRRGRRIRQVYLWALRRAERSVDITCAYFAPRPLFLRALAGAVKRGVRVRILVPLKSDVELADQAALPLLRWLDARGVQIFAYGGAILHAKTAVVDDEWCTVGSHNLDGLSWAWNLECNAVLRSPELGARLTALFEADLCRSVRWPPQKPGLLERLLPDAFRQWYAGG